MSDGHTRIVRDNHTAQQLWPFPQFIQQAARPRFRIWLLLLLLSTTSNKIFTHEAITSTRTLDYGAATRNGSSGPTGWASRLLYHLDIEDRSAPLRITAVVLSNGRLSTRTRDYGSKGKK